MLEIPSEPPCGLNPAGTISGKRIVFLGRMGGLNRRDAIQLVRQQGGLPVDNDDSDIDLIVIGCDELPLADEELLSADQRVAVSEGRIEIINEAVLWERMGLVPTEGNVRQLYTSAMLAGLLNLPLATIRRWHRRGLIVPVREVHKLTYFDFQEVATARQLAQLLAAGATASSIEKKLSQLARWVPNAERPLAQLSVIVEGRDLLLRDGEGLIDSSGQRRIDFDAVEAQPKSESSSATEPSAISESSTPAIYSLSDFSTDDSSGKHSRSDLIRQATELEEDGRLEEAVDLYRAVLAIHGPDPEINFRMAELLYRTGDISAARERYYNTLELDEDYVEARANLGCVLAETGQYVLAIAAFEGALARHSDYPDVHYHLARTLDELNRTDEAVEHWRSFLKLSPESPWAVESLDRLGWDEP